MNYTSIEQSKKLLELGLSPNTSDLWYSLDETDPEYNVLHIDESLDWDEITVYDRALPCWSVGALLELANRGACSDEMVVLEIDSYLLNPGAHIYIDNTESGHITRGNYIGKSIMEVVYDFVVWLLENNYIKND